MADQNITELPIKTNSGVANTDYMLGIDASEGYQILVRDVAKYIVENYNGSTLAGSAQTPKSAIDTLNGNITPTALTLTYTSNSYVSETDFKRLKPFKIGSLLVCNGNFSITNNMPTATSDVTIGTISGWSATNPIQVDVPMQNGTGVAYISISTAGVVTLTNLSGVTIKGWCRFNASTI